MVFVVAGIVVFLLLLIFTNRKTRGCRWRAQPTGAGKPKLYKCMACGATTRTDTGKPPQLCLNPRRPPAGR